MEWYALVLVLSLASSAQGDCSSQCVICAQQNSNVDIPVNSMTCTLECEGVFSSTVELDKCEKALHLYADGYNGFANEEENAPNSVEKGLESSVGNLVKRYGGFIKRIDKNKMFNYPSRENAQFKDLLAKKYGSLSRKFGERDVPELSQDVQRGDSTTENDTEVYSDDAPINEVKRYGGFLRKLVPKRSESGVENDQEGLQKRYGGFMRRIRPNLKWENQKRYGGFLRRHFKISVRSEEEPSSYDGFDL
ncbi:proenkephalin-B-like [Paramormyrops kingsleyae]|uniref:Proenkephalin-B n=1 Tax=Paramormyrops kingsleyae TaxID=1676925 RepID=A0A3B3SLT7_9TELE|nr:proenkephalin-B-like [Paramormyrops kingsleyae]